MISSIADIWLPGMDGLTFVTRARALRPAAMRVLLVDYADRIAAEPIVMWEAIGG
jgi:CheY-like chemotaxis protein